MRRADREAHAAGIVHRDVKPDNVFLHRTRSGEVIKVLDFGIAKLLEGAPDKDAPMVTGGGAFVGTPTYMWHQSGCARPYDGRSDDVYSVGVMLYQMLCGRPPFESPAQSYLGDRAWPLEPAAAGAAGETAVDSRVGIPGSHAHLGKIRRIGRPRVSCSLILCGWSASRWGRSKRRARPSPSQPAVALPTARPEQRFRRSDGRQLAARPAGHLAGSTATPFRNELSHPSGESSDSNLGIGSRINRATSENAIIAGGDRPARSTKTSGTGEMPRIEVKEDPSAHSLPTAVTIEFDISPSPGSCGAGSGPRRLKITKIAAAGPWAVQPVDRRPGPFLGVHPTCWVGGGCCCAGRAHGRAEQQRLPSGESDRSGDFFFAARVGLEDELFAAVAAEAERPP